MEADHYRSRKANANAGLVEEICEISVKVSVLLQQWKYMKDNRGDQLKAPGGSRAVPPTQANTCKPPRLSYSFLPPTSPLWDTYFSGASVIE